MNVMVDLLGQKYTICAKYTTYTKCTMYAKYTKYTMYTSMFGYPPPHSAPFGEQGCKKLSAQSIGFEPMLPEGI